MEDIFELTHGLLFTYKYFPDEKSPGSFSVYYIFKYILFKSSGSNERKSEPAIIRPNSGANKWSILESKIKIVE